MAILKNNPVGYDIGHGVTVYNLENQVLKNKVDIQNLQTSEKVLATFGIKVIGTAANSTLIPTVAVYKANNPDWEYGDAYAVGTQSPYEFYILTRAGESHAEDYWFNLGVIKGPKGDPGNDGANGADGKDGVSPTVGVGTVTTGNPGTPVSVTNGGTSTNVVLNFRIPKGEKGDKGAKGDKGDTGFAINIASELNNVNELPTASASYVNIGYIIKDADGDSNLYVCMTNASTGAWYWNNVGKIAFSADYVSQDILILPDTATQGTLTPTELSRLTTNKYCLIELNNEIYYLNDDQHWTGTLVYTHNGYTTGTTDQKGLNKYIIITISTRGWVKVDDDLFDIIGGAYSEADGWISFEKEPEIRQNGGTAYTIVLQSSQVPDSTMTMPIHLFLNGNIIYGSTVTVKMKTNILNITPFMRKIANNWHLQFNAFIMNGEQAGTDIAAQLLPTLTLIGLIRVSY